YSADRILPRESGAAIGSPLRSWHRARGHALPALGVRPIRSGTRAKPIDVQLPGATRCAAHGAPAPGCRHADILAGASHARPAPRARIARRCATAGVCRTILGGEEPRGAAHGDGAAGQALSSAA